ncbi:MAG: DUF2281 domain-containing protein [Elainella sp.]
MSQDTLTKEQILQELEKLPEARWLEVLEFIQVLQASSEPSTQENSNSVQQSEAWAAYLASKQERAEVYRRLANS